MKRVAILQSNYIPWKGYFDLIQFVDEFVIYDDVQYTKNDWRNRNLIKTPSGLLWLTVPVRNIHLSMKIQDVKICGNIWAKKHWKTIKQYYSGTPYFAEIASWLTPMFLEREYMFLSELNRTLIDAVCQYLGITTIISNSRDYGEFIGRTERLVDICRKAQATEYVSGPAAKCYLDEKLFASNGIAVHWFDYAGYPEYPQLYGAFEHRVSIIDLMMNCGANSMKYIKR